MEITGLIHKIGKTEQVSDKFKKREFVLLDNSSQYPQHISFQLTQDKCNLLDQYATGAEITVHFNLRGREWTSPQGEVKYFNTLEAWRIEGDAKAVSSHNPTKATQSSSFSPAQDDDLPF